MFEYVLLKQSKSDFIEHLFYIKECIIYIYYPFFYLTGGS